MIEGNWKGCGQKCKQPNREENTRNAEDGEGREEEKKMFFLCSIQETLVFSLGNSRVMVSLSSRIVLYSALIFASHFITVFSARLTSSLSVKKFEDQIHDLEDLEPNGYHLYIHGKATCSHCLLSTCYISLHLRHL